MNQLRPDPLEKFGKGSGGVTREGKPLKTASLLRGVSFPAGRNAVAAVRNFLENNQNLEKIIFSVFDAENYEIYKHKLSL